MQLKNTLLIFDSFHNIEEKYKKDKNIYAEKLLYSWSQGEWFQNKQLIPEKVTLCVFKVPGETNIDDLSPDQNAWSRHDIPLHALSMLKTPREGIVPNVNYEIGPIDQIQTLKDSGFPIAYVGDVVGTGSNRKSATNSIQWHFGKDIPYVPNKKTGGYCFGSEIAPIFYNTMEDSGALPIEMDVTWLYTGQLIDLYVHKGITADHNTGETLCRWSLKQENLLDSVTAGGRIPLIIGKKLTTKAQQALNNTSSSIFISNEK
jgi:aconitate hydratase 2/2-methylisocitrate dehydratase